MRRAEGCAAARRASLGVRVMPRVHALRCSTQAVSSSLFGFHLPLPLLHSMRNLVPFGQPVIAGPVLGTRWERAVGSLPGGVGREAAKNRQETTPINRFIARYSNARIRFGRAWEMMVQTSGRVEISNRAVPYSIFLTLWCAGHGRLVWGVPGRAGTYIYRASHACTRHTHGRTTCAAHS